MKLPGFPVAMPSWMICYILLGFVQNGLVPIILPLASKPGRTAGLTYAAFAAAGLAAPFIGAWSDRHRRHRLTLAGGLMLAAAGLLLHALPGGIAQHMATAALMGLGVASASTVGMMFIVEVVPQTRWDGQISMLQTCISGGQLAGLLVAGALGLRHVTETFLLGAGLLLLTVPLALATAPAPVVKVERPAIPHRPGRGGEAAPIGPQRSLHKVTFRALAGLGHSGLAWFLAAWVVSYTALNGLSVLFTVAMVRDYRVPATVPTSAFAIGVGFSLLIYRLVAGWNIRFGPWRVLSAGISVRVLAVAGMVALTAMHTSATVLPILLCFGVTQIAWPLLSVASNALAVTLSPMHRAESVGLLNAATALGAMIGGVLGGVLLKEGFVWLCAAVLGALLLSLLLACHPKVKLDVT